jgi:hypothetical protein
MSSMLSPLLIPALSPPLILPSGHPSRRTVEGPITTLVIMRDYFVMTDSKRMIDNG